MHDSIYQLPYSTPKCITTNLPPYHHPTAPADTPWSAAAAAHQKTHNPDNRACWRRYILSLRSCLVWRRLVEIAGCTKSPRSGSRAIRLRLLSRLREKRSACRRYRGLAMTWRLQRWRDWDWAIALVAWAVGRLPGAWHRLLSILPGAAIDY
jgi:hypothetical protein